MESESTVKEPLRITGVVVLVLLLLGDFFHLPALTYSGIGLLALSLATSTFNYWFAYLWMKLAHLLGTVNSKIILFIVFYFILTPLSFLYRLIRKSPIQSTDQPINEDSYFYNRNHTFDREDFENPW